MNGSTGPVTTESVLWHHPELLPFMARIVAWWANQRGKGVPRAATPVSRRTPQLVLLSPRQRISNHRRKIGAGRTDIQPGSPAAWMPRPDEIPAPVGVQRGGRA